MNGNPAKKEDNMTPRATLSRILAVNWYGYRQFIDVRGLTLITGANGSGKSALLDLIQFVMLGEQTSRFNKAAAGAGSGRTLRGYCCKHVRDQLSSKLFFRRLDSRN